MNKIVIFFLIAFIFSQAMLFSQNEKSIGFQISKFDPSKDPYVELKSTIKIAKKENKNILLDIGGEWCIWCHRIDSFFVNNKEISDFLISNFTVMKVNVSKENKNEKFLSNYPKVAGYPHFFILNKKGKLIHSQNTAELEEDKGYSKEKVFSFLKKYAPKK